MDSHQIETIVCPQCQSVLDVSAETCGQCGAATTSPSHSRRSESPPLIDRPWLIVVVLLHVGFLGIPLYWATSYSFGVRMGIVLASIVYTVVAVLVIVLVSWKIAQDLGLMP